RPEHRDGERELARQRGEVVGGRVVQKVLLAKEPAGPPEAARMSDEAVQHVLEQRPKNEPRHEQDRYLHRHPSALVSSVSRNPPRTSKRFARRIASER